MPAACTGRGAEEGGSHFRRGGRTDGRKGCVVADEAAGGGARGPQRGEYCLPARDRGGRRRCATGSGRRAPRRNSPRTRSCRPIGIRGGGARADGIKTGSHGAVTGRGERGPAPPMTRGLTGAIRKGTLEGRLRGCPPRLSDQPASALLTLALSGDT